MDTTFVRRELIRTIAATAGKRGACSASRGQRPVRRRVSTPPLTLLSLPAPDRLCCRRSCVFHSHHRCGSGDGASRVDCLPENAGPARSAPAGRFVAAKFSDQFPCMGSIREAEQWRINVTYCAWEVILARFRLLIPRGTLQDMECDRVSLACSRWPAVRPLLVGERAGAAACRETRLWGGHAGDAGHHVPPGSSARCRSACCLHLVRGVRSCRSCAMLATNYVSSSSGAGGGGVPA